MLQNIWPTKCTEKERQKLDFFGENMNYYPFVDAQLQFDVTVRLNDKADIKGAYLIRWISNAIALTFVEVNIQTTSVNVVRIGRYFGPLSTIMKTLITEENFRLVFRKIDEQQTGSEYFSLKHCLMSQWVLMWQPKGEIQLQNFPMKTTSLSWKRSRNLRKDWD